MNETIKKYLEKAEESIKAAEILFKNKMFGFSASRLYYSMFYIASSILLNENKTFNSHKSVISGFGRLFVKTGKFDTKYHKYLIDSYSKRQIGDYEVITDVDEISTKIMIKEAKDFLEAAKQYLNKL